MKPLLICMAIVLFVFALWPSHGTSFIGNIISLAISGLCLLMAFIADQPKGAGLDRERSCERFPDL